MAGGYGGEPVGYGAWGRSLGHWEHCPWKGIMVPWFLLEWVVKGPHLPPVISSVEMWALPLVHVLPLSSTLMWYGLECTHQNSTDVGDMSLNLRTKSSINLSCWSSFHVSTKIWLACSPWVRKSLFPSLVFKIPILFWSFYYGSPVSRFLTTHFHGPNSPSPHQTSLYIWISPWTYLILLK